MEGIIFDMDGVLVETERFHYLAWVKTFESVGITLTYEQYESCCQAQGRTNAIRNMMGNHVSTDEISRLSQMKERAYINFLQEKGIHFFEDAALLLNRLQRTGIKMAVASSSKNAAFVLEKAGWIEWFDCIVTGNEIVNNKPNPEIFFLAAQRLGLPKEELMIIEDSPAGIHGAIRSGISVIVLNRDEMPMVLSEEMKQARQEKRLRVIHSLNEIK